MFNELKNFEFSKKYGQNFIFDDVLLSRIVEKSGVTNSSSVLEIGAGAGTLTKTICAAAKQVVSYEIDLRLEKVLRPLEKEFSNLQFQFKDVLSQSLEETELPFVGGYHVIANLPYYITSPIILHFLKSSKMESMTVMVQKEVGERICSGCGFSEYGVLSVLVQSKCSAEIIEHVPRDKFTPPPNVDSTVIKLTRHNNYNIASEVKFEKTVKAAFTMKRKTLLNNLIGSFSVKRVDAEKILEKLNVPVSARAEELSVAHFIALSEILSCK